MGNGVNGVAQAYGNYIWPGRLDGSGGNWQQAWYLGSHSSYGLYTNTGIYISGTSYAPFIYDSQNTGYYMDPNGTSQFANLYRAAGYNGPEYDVNNAGYYIDLNGNSRMANGYFDRTLINWPGYNGITQGYGHYIWPGRLDGSGADWQQAWYLGSHSSYGLYTNTGMYFTGNVYLPFMYDSQNTGYYVDPNSVTNVYDLRSSHYYDNNNTGYYMDLDQQTHMNVLYPNSINCMYAWCPANQVMRLTPNLHLNSVGGYAVYLNWDNGGAAAGTYQLVVGNGGGAYAFIARADGALYSAASGWIASDERLKTNVQPVSKALDKILALEGVTFEYRKDIPNRTPSEGTHLGLIAQQVEKVIPEVVGDGPEGYKTVAYTDLIPVIIEGVKEQQNQLNDLADSFKDYQINQDGQFEQINQKLQEHDNQIQSLKQELKDQQTENTKQNQQINSLQQQIDQLKQELKNLQQN